MTDRQFTQSPSEQETDDLGRAPPESGADDRGSPPAGLIKGPAVARRTAQIRIVIPTFRRTELLRRLLDRVDQHLLALASSADTADIPDRTRVLVIDNDPDASAQPIVSAVDHLTLVDYLHEPRPGIGAVRARALAEVDAGSIIIFIDDDELPGSRWIEPLVRMWEGNGAEIIVGRVLTDFIEPPPAWVVAGNFFDRLPHPTGTEVTAAATSNMLLDVDGVAALGLTFDASRGLHGGEDTLLTRSLHRAGGRIVWCAESEVHDLVPPDRATRRWVLARRFSHATMSVWIDLSLTDSWLGRFRVRTVSALRGSALLGRGAARGLFGALSRNLSQEAHGARDIARGSGLIGGAVGHKYEEYSRS